MRSWFLGLGFRVVRFGLRLQEFKARVHVTLGSTYLAFRILRGPAH